VLPREARGHEPRTSLGGGADGWLSYAASSKGGRVAPGGCLHMEISADKPQASYECFAAAVSYRE
jgi:hypothetical protein